ncbi:MAG: hypothetical protein BLM47_04700 [Candidatus Reconcilbacillus cellulovorans]|uniref:Uncharacterized protein n=1 Tax=Candidatus Reconcilbacillus cellulovorans TaxID=1906605 RepID=A0A2A6E0X2_9BACL|nr:MAG: hypothetical protein BLM47_04700 [Candidatus Reconcilbacillus cellulovorans]
MTYADRCDRVPGANSEVFRLDSAACQKIVHDVLPMILLDLARKGKWPPKPPIPDSCFPSEGQQEESVNYR